jgi:hypothetical protein
VSALVEHTYGRWKIPNALPAGGKKAKEGTTTTTMATGLQRGAGYSSKMAKRSWEGVIKSSRKAIVDALEKSGSKSEATANSSSSNGKEGSGSEEDEHEGSDSSNDASDNEDDEDAAEEDEGDEMEEE